jgi:hypothetical protein
MADATALQGDSVPAYVESGIILDVDIENYTVAAATQFTRRPQYGITFATPYQHHHNGEGMYFMPEVGSTCWICFPSDGQRPFVIAWGPPLDDAGGHRGAKKELNPGDIYLGTRDENFLILRRGGVIQIGGGPLNQRMYLPINNVIKDFCENYELHTLGGDLEWSVDLSEKTKDGERPASLKLNAREYAGDPNPIAFLEIGSHSGDPQTILSLTVNANGSDGARTMIGLQFQKDGKANWLFDNDVDWSYKGNLAVTVTGNSELVAGGAATLKGAVVLVKSTDPADGFLDLRSSSFINVKAATQVNVGPAVQLGVGGAGVSTPVMLASSSFLTFLLSHTHLVIGPGVETGMPAIPGSMGITPYTGTDHVSQTTQAK